MNEILLKKIANIMQTSATALSGGTPIEFDNLARPLQAYWLEVTKTVVESINKAKSDEKQINVLPTWEEANSAWETGTCTVLEKFIRDNEPGRKAEEIEWRNDLFYIINDPNKMVDVHS